MSLAGVPSASFFRPAAKPSPITSFCFVSRSTTQLIPSIQRARRGDAFECVRSDERLEEEIFEFMRSSDKPETFPTRTELIEAGRRDLAEAVASHGGWLAFGWDLERGEGSGRVRGGEFGEFEYGFGKGLKMGCEYRSEFEPDYSDFQKIHPSGSEFQSGVHPDYPEPSFSGRSIEEEESTDKGGVEGIIKRVERERKLSHLSKKSKKKAQNGKASYTRPELDPGENNKVSIKNRRPIEIKEANNRVKIPPLKEEIIGSQNGKCSSGSNGSVRAICDKWTRWSIKNNIKVETIPTDVRLAIEHSPPKDISNNNNNTNNINNNNYNNNTSVGPNGCSERIESLSLEREEIHTRLQHLESSLNSSLKSLRSKVKHLLSQHIEESTNDEVSDDWEFRETEIMKAKTEVRSLRARLSVLEGKMALKIIEAQKLLEENEKRYEISQRAYFGLKTVCIVWPNIANEVLLAGSFNGWTNQRKMEKSTEGIFTLNLTLYPGQYEIKFIVDGIWKVDPLRPVVHNNGHENNLLTVL
ncbi:hypothetical protein LUZ60_005269 [Juncus effusus]|nr:hypothetical protein LUZ60_005269 [Juncus effusus]